MNPGSFRPLLALVLALGLTGCGMEDTSSGAVPAAPPYLAIARGRLDVEGGVLKLGTQREGVVKKIWVREGDQVRKGQLLASLDSELAQLAVSAAQAEQQQLEVRAKQLARHFKAADLKAKRLTTAASVGAGDQQSADDAREAAQQLHDRIEDNDADAAVTRRKLASARYELEQRNIVSPADAQIVRSFVQLGASLSASSGPAFILLPTTERIIRAELNESFIGIVVPGMKAQVTDDTGSGLPAISAHVLRVSPVFGNSTLEDDPQTRGNLRTVECILVLDQAVPASVRIGQRMLVHFGVDRSQRKRFHSPFPADAE